MYINYINYVNFFDNIQFNDDGKFNDDVHIRVAHILNGDDENRIDAIKEAAKICLDHMEYDDNM